VTHFQPTDLLTAWTATPFGVVLVVVVAGWYLWQVRLARSEGVPWPWWRVGLYLVVGVGSLAYAVCGPLATYRSQLFWIGALQVGTLASLTPVGIALGDPVTLLRQRRLDRPYVLLRLLDGRVARALMFPAVSTILAVTTLLVVFFTPVFVATTRSATLQAVLDVVLLVSGLLFVLPLMVDELLPSWATPGIRTLLAFADGLLDAGPGILLMTAGTVVVPTFPGFVGRVGPPDPLLDTHLGGGALLAVAESVGLPVIGAVFAEWIRADAREAREVDARLDAAESPGEVAPAPPTPLAAEDPQPALESGTGLWWESDPRFGDRFRHRPD
jgi:putative copper resistance protein D